MFHGLLTSYHIHGVRYNWLYLTHCTIWFVAWIQAHHMLLWLVCTMTGVDLIISIYWITIQLRSFA